MNRIGLLQLVKEVIDELSTTGTGSGFNSGEGMQYATPRSFKKKVPKRK